MGAVNKNSVIGAMLAALIVVSGCSSPFLAKIKDKAAAVVAADAAATAAAAAAAAAAATAAAAAAAAAAALKPFAATIYSFTSQWGDPSPQYSFGSSVVKVDTAGFVYVADSTFRIRKFNAAGALQKTYDVITATGISGNVYDMAFDSSGNMYVATNGTNRIQKYDLSGALVAQWGTSATIGTAAGIATDTAGNVYVVDSNNSKVLKYDSSGNPGTPASWSGNGINNQGAAFSGPSGIAIDANGILYVADSYNNVVKEYYASSGAYITAWPIAFSDPRGITVDASNSPTFYVADSGNNRIVKTNGSTITSSWGSLGTANGQFTSLASVAVDSSGYVYAADVPAYANLAGGNGRIQKFDGTGSYLASWGGLILTGNGQLQAPGGVAFDSSGNIYVSDSGNSRIEKFSSTGAYLAQWGNSSIYKPWLGSIAVDAAGNVYAPDQTNKYVQVLDSSLNHVKNIGAGVLSSPVCVALDAAGNIYVGDIGLGKIMIFDANGYTTHSPQSIGTPLTTTTAADGQLGWPVGVAVDSAGNVYVADLPLFYTRTNMIQKFDSAGNFVKGWGTTGTGDGQLGFALGIGVDKYNNVLVCDFVGRRVEKYDSNGTFKAKWGGVGVGSGTFGWPFNVAVNSSGNVIVADATNNLVELFTPVY